MGVGISFLANAMWHPPPCGLPAGRRQIRSSGANLSGKAMRAMLEWLAGVGGWAAGCRGTGAWEHPLPAALGLSAKLRYLPHQGGGGGAVLGAALRHSRIALMAFSPQISPPERFALRDGSKPLIRPFGPPSPRGGEEWAGVCLLFLSPSGRGWIGRSPRRVRGMGGRVFDF